MLFHPSRPNPVTRAAEDYMQGAGRMTVFFNGAKARTADFRASDVGYVPKTFAHYIENTGDTGLIFPEMFKATPPRLIMEHRRITEETLRKISKDKVSVMPS